MVDLLQEHHEQNIGREDELQLLTKISAQPQDRVRCCKEEGPNKSKSYTIRTRDWSKLPTYSHLHMLCLVLRHTTPFSPHSKLTMFSTDLIHALFWRLLLLYQWDMLCFETSFKSQQCSSPFNKNVLLPSTSCKAGWHVPLQWAARTIRRWGRWSHSQHRQTSLFSSCSIGQRWAKTCSKMLTKPAQPNNYQLISTGNFSFRHSFWFNQTFLHQLLSSKNACLPTPTVFLN